MEKPDEIGEVLKSFQPKTVDVFKTMKSSAGSLILPGKGLCYPGRRLWSEPMALRQNRFYDFRSSMTGTQSTGRLMNRRTRSVVLPKNIVRMSPELPRFP